MMILMDNSDWSRNGDYHSTRWEAQKDVADMMSNQICNANKESEVGLMTTAGR